MEPPDSSSFTSVIQLPAGLRDSKLLPDKHPGTAHALCHSTLPKTPFPFLSFQAGHITMQGCTTAQHLWIRECRGRDKDNISQLC